ncbi:MAG: ATP-binding protein [Chloroflexota bacterium]
MRGLRVSSLRGRLALWYLVVFGALLALFGAIVFLQVRNSLLDGIDTALRTRAETVLSQVSIETDGPQYQGSDAPAAQTDVAVYLFDARGQLRDRIVGAKELPPRSAVLGPALRGQALYASVGGMRLYMAPLRDEQGQLSAVVQVVESLSTVNEQITRLLLLLLGLTPVLLAVATAGGLFLAGRALAPIDRITRTAEVIGAGNLAGRLGPTPRADEVGRLAATFDGMLDRLERAFAQQRQFTADASHELRTPLTIIAGDLDVVLRRRRAPEAYEEVLHGVRDEVSHMGHLVEDLLTLARADSGQVELAREFVYLEAIVEDAATGSRRLAEARGVELTALLERDVAVLGDPTRLRQLVVNLLSNAVTYTPAGGRIGVSLSTAGGWARLAVADTGIGITPADLPYIFDRFFRSDAARTRASGGTGLGLAIARWCAEAHGGELRVESSPGEGSVFTVILPLAPMAPHEALAGPGDVEQENRLGGRASSPHGAASAGGERQSSGDME